ncbi:protein of unknown function [Kyrpidia spormannii]|nr:protein of unknown function [Kyrpidia spormannii]
MGRLNAIECAGQTGGTGPGATLGLGDEKRVRGSDRADPAISARPLSAQIPQDGIRHL